MFSDLSDNDLIEAAQRRSRKQQPLPLDLAAELMKRGFDLTPYNR